MKLLIVEDDPEVANMLIAVMKRRNAEVKHCTTLALAQLQVQWCDVVLCDGVFPTYDAEPPRPNWQKMLGQALRFDKGFILYTGEERFVEQAISEHVLAFQKGSTRNDDLWNAIQNYVDTPNGTE